MSDTATATRPRRRDRTVKLDAREHPETPEPAAEPKAKATKADKPAKAAKATVEHANGTVERIVIELEYAGETKNYKKFVPPEGTGCTGTFYAPLSAGTVKVAITA